MSTSVLKFGGTSVGTAEMVKCAANRVQQARNAGERVAVVVSAASPETKKNGTTNRLNRLSEIRWETGKPPTYTGEFEEVHNKVLQTYADLLRGLGLSENLLDPHARDLERMLSASSLHDCTLPNARGGREERADRRVMAWGEATMAPFFAQALRERGIDAEAIDPRRLIAMERNTQGRESGVLIHDTYERIERLLTGLLAQGKVPVFGGFFGADSCGNTMLHSRGGSDYSAALCAAALGADRLDICTDVPGILQGPPALIQNPAAVPQVSYRELLALALGGAQVVHPQAVSPVWGNGTDGSARRKPISMRIVETRTGQSDTIINDQVVPGLKSIASKGGFARLRITQPGMSDATGVLRIIANHVATWNVDALNTERSSIALTAENNRADGVVETLRRHLPHAIVETKPNCGSIVIVGHGIQRERRAINALMDASAGIRELITEGPDSFTIVVPESEREELVRSLHRDVFA